MVDASFPSRFRERLGLKLPIPLEKLLTIVPDVEKYVGRCASEGGFSVSKYRNLVMVVCAAFAAMLISCCAQAQNKAEAIAYGANPAAGHYLRVDDVNIYCETYGAGGTPLVLLHGGLYGYIEEF